MPNIQEGQHMRVGLLFVKGLLFLALFVFVVVMTRNTLKEYHYIGKSAENKETITITATGEAQAIPDVAVTNVGVSIEGKTVTDAQKRNTEIMNRVIDQVKKLGIADEDLKTQNYNIYPQYDYNEGSRTLRGYEVSQTLRVKIRNIEDANKVLSLAGQEGITNVSGLQFIVDERDMFIAKAREDAMMMVAEKRKAIEESLGVTLGSVVGYDEYTGGLDPEPYYRALGGDTFGVSESAAPAVQAGSEDIQLQVSVTYELL